MPVGKLADFEVALGITGKGRSVRLRAAALLRLHATAQGIPHSFSGDSSDGDDAGGEGDRRRSRPVRSRESRGVLRREAGIKRARSFSYTVGCRISYS